MTELSTALAEMAELQRIQHTFEDEDYAERLVAIGERIAIAPAADVAELIIKSKWLLREYMESVCGRSNPDDTFAAAIKTLIDGLERLDGRNGGTLPPKGAVAARD